MDAKLEKIRNVTPKIQRDCSGFFKCSENNNISSVSKNSFLEPKEPAKEAIQTFPCDLPSFIMDRVSEKSPSNGSPVS